MENLELKEESHKKRRYFVIIPLIIGLLFSCFTPAVSFAIGPDSYDSTPESSDSITAAYPYYAFVEDPDNPWETVWDALDSTDTINYSDSYFDTPSPGDHP